MNFKSLFLISLGINLLLAALLIQKSPGQVERADSPRMVASISDRTDPVKLSVSETPKINAAVNHFDWALVEAPDYKNYIKNLRAVGCPEETIRDIIEADVMKLYDEKKKEVRKGAPKFEYWKGDNFLREKGRETWMKMFGLDEERDKMMRELGVEPNYRKKALKEQNARDWMLDFLGEEKKTQILRMQKELEDKLSMRTPNSQEADGMQKVFEEHQNGIKRLLNPEEAFQYDLRMSPVAAKVRNELTAMDPSEEEFIALYKIRLEREKAASTTNPSESIADRKARRILEKEKLEAQIKQALGLERYSDYQAAQDPQFQATHNFARQANLGPQEIKQLYQIRKEAERGFAEIENNPGLMGEKRIESIQAIQKETARALQSLLSEAAWEQYKRGGYNRWLNSLVPPSVQKEAVPAQP